jgi:putative CocE/NonD family hydrolase
VRIAEFEVPRARYVTLPVEQRGGCGTAASRTPFYRFDFDAAQLQALHGSATGYVQAYKLRSDALVSQHWLLAADAARLVAQAESAAKDIETRAIKTTVSSFGHYQPAKRYSDQLSSSFYLTMRDGTKLAVRLLQPAVNGKIVAGRFPVVWQHALTISFDSPDLTGPRRDGYRSIPQLTDYGYVIAQVARRGNGQSFGARRGYHERNEAYDAYEVTEWLASQPWSSGAVGVYGCSNTGDAAMHALTVAPPHLKAAFAGCFSWNKYDAMRRGGIFAQWGTGPQRTLEEDMTVEPVAGDEDKKLLRQAAEQHQQSTVLYDLWKGMPYRDSFSPLVASRFWSEGSASSFAADIRRSQVPLYIQGAWNDEFRDQGLIAHLNIPGSRVLIGPWKHCENTGFLLIEEIHRFFDTHLKGIDTGLLKEDPIHYFTVNAAPAGEWRSTRDWPLLKREYSLLRLLDGAKLAAPITAGARGTAGVGAQQALDISFKVNAAISSCTEAGSGSTVQPCHLAGEGLSFATDALSAEREVTGEVLVNLHVAVDRNDANLFAFLEDVAPDGKLTIVTEGRQRASLRTPNAAPWRMPATPWMRSNAEDVQLLQPGVAVRLQFAMLPTSYVFRAGHRLQITVTGADHRERDRPAQNAGATIRLLGAESNFVELPQQIAGGAR